MPTNEQIDRLAKTINILRPDWPIPSLITYLTRSHQSRPYRDLAIALTAVAVDSKSKTPKRVEEAGPWWKAAQIAFAGEVVPDVGPGREPRCEVYGHEHQAARTCVHCRTEALSTGVWPNGSQHQERPAHPYEPEPYEDARTRAAGDHR